MVTEFHDLPNAGRADDGAETEPAPRDQTVFRRCVGDFNIWTAPVLAPSVSTYLHNFGITAPPS